MSKKSELDEQVIIRIENDFEEKVSAAYKTFNLLIFSPKKLLTICNKKFIRIIIRDICLTALQLPCIITDFISLLRNTNCSRKICFSSSSKRIRTTSQIIHINHCWAIENSVIWNQDRTWDDNLYSNIIISIMNREDLILEINNIILNNSINRMKVLIKLSQRYNLVKATLNDRVFYFYIKKE